MAKKDLNAAAQKATAGFFSGIETAAEADIKTDDARTAVSEIVETAAGSEAEEKSSSTKSVKAFEDTAKGSEAKEPVNEDKAAATSKSKPAASKKSSSAPAAGQESSKKHGSVSDAELGARLSDHGEKELRNIRKGFLLSKKAVANLTHLSEISDRKPNDMINYLLENIFDLIK